MKKFAQYTLVRRVGVGGMGEVWMAHRPLRNSYKVVALKLMSPQIYADEKYRTLFDEEVRISSTLVNSCIVQAHDAAVHEGVCYLEMEWVDGVDLARLNRWLWQSERKLPLHVGAHIIAEILRGLEFAHEHEVIHRDISPQNIMLSLAGEVKITDFGVAKNMTQETTGEDFKGKLIYAGPERIINPDEFGADPRLDLFAVGAIFEEIVTGQRFRASFDTLESLMGAIRGMAPAEPLSALPLALDEFRRHLLNPDPERRATNARSALAMLRTWPGFRDARTDLQQLVREYQAQMPQEVPARVDNLAGPSTSESGELTRVNSSGRGNQEITVALDAALPAQEHSNMQTHRRIALALAALGTCIGSCGIGAALALGLQGPPAQPVPAASPEVVVRTDHPPAPAEPAPPKIPLSAPEPANVEPPKTEPPNIEPAQTVDNPPPAPKKSCPPAPVTLLAGQYPFAWIKVGGRSYALEPMTQITLPCNRKHVVQMRLSEDEDWAKLGQIEVEANKRYRVKLRKIPPRLDITVEDA